MQDTTFLEVGGIYKTGWDERPFRILAFDEVEILYDCFWPHDNSWTFKNRKKKSYYYRISTPLFTSKSEKINVEPISDEEYSLYRPDLPLRLCRFKELSWIAGFEGVESNITFNASKVVLVPRGEKGALKKGVIVTSIGKVFTYAELMLKASSIQIEHAKEQDKGIGLYRLGVDYGLPSYYIGGYYDTAGYIKQFESFNHK